MQRNMPISLPNLALNPIDDAVGVGAVDYTADFDGLCKRVDNLNKIYESGRAPGNLIRYIPGLAKLIYQG